MAFGLKAKEVDPDEPLLFAYTAVSTAGQRMKAKMTAPSAAAVSAALAADGWIPVEIAQVRSGGLNFDIGALLSNRPLKMGHGPLSAFARQMHQLLKAGISVPRAIASLGEDADPRMTAMCTDIAEKVSGGLPLSRAFSDYPRCFDDVFCAYITAGEQSGALVTTTARLAKMLEKRADLALKVKSVTAYPKMVGGAIGMLVIGIMAFLVPSYAKIYASFGAKLPAPTAALVSFSKVLSPVKFYGFGPLEMIPIVHGIPLPNPLSPTLYILAVIFGIKAFLKATKDNLEIGTKLDRLKFRLPIVGDLSSKLCLYRWSSTLAGALESGVQMGQALELAARASGSRWQLAILAELKEAVRGGRLLSDVLAGHRDLFTPSVRTMVTTGEAAGELADMLDNVSSSLDAEIDSIVAGLSAKIEVALLLLLGGVVGGLLVVLYMPILNLATTVGEGLEKGG